MKKTTEKVNLSQETIDEAEKWSLMMDGMLSDAQVDALLDQFDAETAQEWQTYHLIGDVLRSPDMAHSHVVLAKSRYYAQIKEQLSQEPLIMAPVKLPRSASHKKWLNIRWPQLVGFAAASGFVVFAVISVVNINTDDLLGEKVLPGGVSAVQTAGGSTGLPEQALQVTANADISGTGKQPVDEVQNQSKPSSIVQQLGRGIASLRFINTAVSRPQRPGQALVPYLSAHRQFGYGATLNSSTPLNPYIVQTTADNR